MYMFFTERKREGLREAEKNVRHISVAKETSNATGVSERTVLRIVNEKKTKGDFASPERKVSASEDPLQRGKVMDDFDVCAMRRIIHGKYLRGENVTLDTITAALLDELDIDISRSTVRRRLLQNGFKFRKVNNRKILIEKPEIIAARCQFLRTLRRIRSETPDKEIIYLDETWYNQFDMKTHAWLDDSEISGMKTVVGKGKRLIVVHAGSENGFVKDALLVMRTDGSSSDYHSSMNSQVFESWFRSLLRNIPENSCIVMDNASYHSKVANKTPSSSWRKADIQEWLTKNGITFNPDMRKPELLELVRPLRRKKLFVLDGLAAEHGHQVVRLPPYHCDLNPIELIWSQLKRFVRSRNTTGRLEDLERLLLEGVQLITPEDWAGCCRHVVGLEQRYWEEDGMMEDIEPVVVNLRSDSSSSDDTSEDEVM